jgi:colanic acid/amylovoran biosynthesis protein
MKIVVANTVALNAGDAAILHGVIAILQSAFGNAAELVAYDHQPAAARKYYPDIHFEPTIYSQILRPKPGSLWERISERLGRAGYRPQVVRLYVAAWLYSRGCRFAARLLLPRAEFRQLDRLNGVDLVVSTGGTYLVEHYDLENKLFDLRVALLLKRPVVLFTQSLGPFHARHNRRLVKWIVNRALAVLLRDQKSLDHLTVISCRQNRLQVAPDAAFALGGNCPLYRPPLPPRIAISVREWVHFRTPADGGFANYAECIRKLVIHLVKEHDARVTFLSTCQGLPEYWTDDSKTALRVLEEVPAEIRPHILVDREFRRPEALLSELAGYSAVVATRMHMAILALCAGTPVVPIAYEFKTEELFRTLGYEHLVHSIETVSAEALQASVEAVLNNMEAMRVELRQKVKELCAGAFAAGVLVRDAFEKETQTS